MLIALLRAGPGGGEVGLCGHNRGVAGECVLDRRGEGIVRGAEGPGVRDDEGVIGVDGVEVGLDDGDGGRRGSGGDVHRAEREHGAE